MNLIRLLLVLWIVSIVVRWYKRARMERARARDRFRSAADPGAPVNPNPGETGPIVDAEYEILDGPP